MMLFLFPTKALGSRVPTQAPESRRSIHLIAATMAFAILGAANPLYAETGAPPAQPVAVALEASVLPPYNGQWMRIDDEEAETLRLMSIDAAVEDLSWILRKMAAGVLKKSATAPAVMRFEWNGERLDQIVPGKGGDMRRPVQLDAQALTLTDPRGEDFSSTWTWTENGLQVDWSQAQAYGTNVYRIDEHGHTLFAEHRIHITGMDGIDPIVYHARFGRIEPPPVSAAMDRNDEIEVANELR